MTISRDLHLWIWLLNALGTAAFAADEVLPGVRHALRGSQDDAAYCSLLAPVSWQLEQAHDDETHRDRFLFHPPNASYPYLMVDAWRAVDGELDHEREMAQRLPRHLLLDENAAAQSFDPTRAAVWQIVKSDRLLMIRVRLLRNPMLMLQFAGPEPVDPAEQQTLLKVIDTIEFDASVSKAGATAKSATITQPKFLLQTESESLAGRGGGYWIAGSVVGVLLALVTIERTLRRRDETRRIREVEEAVLARQRSQQEEEDAWTPRPRANPKRRKPSSK